MDKLAHLLTLAATILLGLMAGFFFAFWVDVAPAMRELDAAGYVTAQQAINRAVRNAPFALAYFGAAIVPALAAACLWIAGQRRTAIAWTAIAACYFVGVFLLTREINVPINEALALWNPASPPPQWQQVRDRWNDANLVRGLLNLAAFAGAVIACAATARAHRVPPEQWQRRR
jgi:uncharacterized membrane protein